MENKNIEVEIRSFIDDKQYNNLLLKLKIDAEFIKEIDEETIYFSGDKDLRLRNNKKEAFMILKGGNIHDDHREELEVKFNIADFDNMQKLLECLGHKIEIKWFRRRLEFRKDDIKILLDRTKGYGNIIELEKMVQSGEEENVHIKLEKRLKKLGIKISTKKEFNYAFEYYKKNWKNLIK